jgi:hypothetical protein
LLLVDPAQVPEPLPSIGRRRTARLGVAHAMTNPPSTSASSSCRPATAGAGRDLPRSASPTQHNALLHR